MSAINAQFVITGANTVSKNITTTASGTAVFTYTGNVAGTDNIQAQATVNGSSSSSNFATVSWYSPVQPLSTSLIFGSFYTSNGSGSFNTLPSQTPVFTQTFPTINFNPQSNLIPGDTTTVDNNTRPFTDITTDLNGNYSGAIVAQGNGYQAGVLNSSLENFNVVFTSTLVVAAAGNVTFSFYDDDGFVLYMGNGAQAVSGVGMGSYQASAFTGLPYMGSYNTNTQAFGHTITINFPVPGVYPYEVDYSECCRGGLALTMGTSTAGNGGIPPSGSITFSPNNNDPALAVTIGQSRAITATVTDITGVVQANKPVTFTVTGANPQVLTATTNVAGQAIVSYSGTNVGTDTVQAVTQVGNQQLLSAQLVLQWSKP